MERCTRTQKRNYDQSVIFDQRGIDLWCLGLHPKRYKINFVIVVTPEYQKRNGKSERWPRRIIIAAKCKISPEIMSVFVPTYEKAVNPAEIRIYTDRKQPVERNFFKTRLARDKLEFLHPNYLACRSFVYSPIVVETRLCNKIVKTIISNAIFFHQNLNI